MTAVGAPGTLEEVGVTASEGADSGPVPSMFVARTRNVYAVPGLRPVTVVLVPDTVLPVCAAAPTYGITS